MYFMYDFIKCPKSFPLGLGHGEGGIHWNSVGGGGGAGSERKESLQILGLQRLVSLLYMCELNVKNIW